MQVNDTPTTKKDKTDDAVTKMEKTASKDAGYDDEMVINPNKLYTVADIASLLGVSRRTIIRYRTEKGLPSSPGPRGTTAGRTLLKWLESRGKN